MAFEKKLMNGLTLGVFSSAVLWVGEFITTPLLGQSAWNLIPFGMYGLTAVVVALGYYVKEEYFSR